MWFMLYLLGHVENAPKGRCSRRKSDKMRDLQDLQIVVVVQNKYLELE